MYGTFWLNDVKHLQKCCSPGVVTSVDGTPDFQVKYKCLRKLSVSTNLDIRVHAWICLFLFLYVRKYCVDVHFGLVILAGKHLRKNCQYAQGQRAI